MERQFIEIRFKLAVLPLTKFSELLINFKIEIHDKTVTHRFIIRVAFKNYNRVTKINEVEMKKRKL